MRAFSGELNDTGCWIIGTGWRRDGLFLEKRETVSSKSLRARPINIKA